MNEYEIFYEFVSNGSVQKQEYETNSYQDVIDCAIENLMSLQSYDSYEANTLVSNSFNF